MVAVIAVAVAVAVAVDTHGTLHAKSENAEQVAEFISFGSDDDVDGSGSSDDTLAAVQPTNYNQEGITAVIDHCCCCWFLIISLLIVCSSVDWLAGP